MRHARRTFLDVIFYAIFSLRHNQPPPSPSVFLCSLSCRLLPAMLYSLMMVLLKTRSPASRWQIKADKCCILWEALSSLHVFDERVEGGKPCCVGSLIFRIKAIDANFAGFIPMKRWAAEISHRCTLYSREHMASFVHEVKQFVHVLMGSVC